MEAFMHTLLLSSVLNKEVYNNILTNTPYNNIPVTSPYVRMDCIANNRLSLTPDEKILMPEVYLFRFEQTKKDGKTIQGTGTIRYFLEIRINYNKSIGGSGYYSMPIEQTKTFMYEAILTVVFTHIPALQPIPREFFNFFISFADDLNQYKQYVHDMEQQLENYPFPHVDLKLRRIDFAYDITTDYKSILLDLMGKGYKPKYFEDNAKTYYGKNSNNEPITESNYLKSKSVYINAYDKEQELQSRNAPLSETDMEKLPYLLRFEVQVHKNKLQYIVKKERENNPSFQRDLFSFLDNELEYTTLKYYMESLIGTGHYFYFDTALEIANNSNYLPCIKKKLCNVIRYVSKYHGIYNFLERVEKGKIKDIDTLSTAKRYLKQLHAIGVNPVTLSNNQQEAMKTIKQVYPLPDLGNYKYGEDFLYNPLVNLQIGYQIAEQLKYEF